MCYQTAVSLQGTKDLGLQILLLKKKVGLWIPMQQCFSRDQQSTSRLNYQCLLDDNGVAFAAEPKARVDEGLTLAEGSMGGVGGSIWSLLTGADGQTEESVLI